MPDSLPRAETLAQNPARRSQALTLATLCMAVLIAQVDTSVVNLAVRAIAEYFKAGVDEMQWVVDSYNLAYALLLLTGGLLADLYGRRRIFMAGAAIFTLASALSALAPTLVMLICGRVLAGLGAALLLPASLAIIRVAWPDPKERGKVLGVWAACNGLAFVIGPPVGGLLISAVGWRSIFLLVVPFGLASLILAPISVPESSDPHGRRLDPGGQTLGAAAIGGLVIAAIEFQRLPLFAGGAFAAAILALLLFLRVEAAGGESSLVHLGMFKVQEFRAAIAATGAMTFGMYGVLFLLPLMWQSAGALGPVGAGTALMPMAMVFVLISPLSGALTAKLGARATTSGGVFIIGCGLIQTGLTAHTFAVGAAEVGLVVMGFGMGLATGPLMGSAVGAVPGARSGSAAALVNVARMVGATLGVAVLGTVFALAHGGAAGLRLSMLVGGGVQIAAAVLAWCAAHPKSSDLFATRSR